MFQRLKRLFAGKSIRLTDIHPRKISYSQCGEDIIVKWVFDALKIDKPTYLDLGAYHPIALSNTYLFYRLGSSGVCVEPNPLYHGEFRKFRARDLLLPVGVGTKETEEAEYFVMSESTLNTFSEAEAMRIDRTTSYKLKEKIRLPLLPINTILTNHFSFRPDFVSLDIEGLDLAILESFAFHRWRPAVFCIETVEFAVLSTDARKSEDVLDCMKQNGYFVYADTFINTIFVDESVWKGDKAG